MCQKTLLSVASWCEKPLMKKNPHSFLMCKRLYRVLHHDVKNLYWKNPQSVASFVSCGKKLSCENRPRCGKKTSPAKTMNCSIWCGILSTDKTQKCASSSLLWNRKHYTEKKETQNVLHPAMCWKKPSSVIIRVERVPEFHSVELLVAVVLMATGCVCRWWWRQRQRDWNAYSVETGKQLALTVLATKRRVCSPALLQQFSSPLGIASSSLFLLPLAFPSEATEELLLLLLLQPRSLLWHMSHMLSPFLFFRSFY